MAIISCKETESLTAASLKCFAAYPSGHLLFPMEARACIIIYKRNLGESSSLHSLLILDKTCYVPFLGEIPKKKQMGMYKSAGNGLMSREPHNSFSH